MRCIKKISEHLAREDEVLGKWTKGDPDAYLYCYINDKSISDEKVDNMIDKKGETWTDWLAEVFQDPKNKKKLPKELQKYIDCEDDAPTIILVLVMQ